MSAQVISSPSSSATRRFSSSNLVFHDCKSSSGNGTGICSTMESRQIGPRLHERVWVVKTTINLRVELVMRSPVFSQSGILPYFPYELDHPRPIDRPSWIVPVLHVQRRVIRDLLLWLYRGGSIEKIIRSMERRGRKRGMGRTGAKSWGVFGVRARDWALITTK